MNREEHEKEVKSLEQLEHQLIELISNIGNDELRSKFLKWQKQRAKCNEGFLDSLKTESNQQPQSQSAEEFYDKNISNYSLLNILDPATAKQVIKLMNLHVQSITNIVTDDDHYDDDDDCYWWGWGMGV